MDPLSITASVIAVIQITNSVLLGCYRLRGQIKDAESEISKIIDEAEQLSSILEHINSILEEDSTNAASILAPLAAESEDGKGPLNSIKAALTELKDKITPLAKPGLKSKLRWPFESKSFQRLLAIIQNQKSTLQLTLSSCQTKLLVQQTNTGTDLRNAIGSVGTQVVETIQDLEKRRRRDAVLKWYKSSDPEQNHQRSRSKHEPDTAKWIFDVKEFQTWTTQNGETIWIHGIPGAGKTILCSTIIDHMQERCRNNDKSCVLYYYFDFSDSTKQSFSSLLKSLIFQLVSRRDSEATGAEALYDKCKETQEPSEDELLEVLIEELKDIETTYLFIDALDECPEAERALFFKSFFTSSLPAVLSVLITSRKEPDIESALKDKVSHNITIQNADIDADVRVHVNNTISKDTAFSKWKPTIRQEMLDAIVSGSNGMFRWAICQLDTLKKCLTPAMVRTELKRMPETLDETYDRILQGIPNLHKKFVQSAMNWLAFSMRPLMVSELAEATVIDPKSERFNPDECRFVDEQLILSLCGTLVSTSSKEYKANNQDWLNEKYEMQYGWSYHNRAESSVQVVTLSHFSVKEYIISERLKESSLSAFYISDRLAHRFLTECCFRYLLDLNLLEMSTKYNEHYALLPLYQYSARFWLDHWRESEMKLEDTKNDLLYTLFDTSDLTGYVNWLSCYNPDAYAFGTDKNMRSFRQQVQFSAHAFPQPIYFAAMMGDLALVQSLVEQGNDILALEGHFGSALGASAFYGHVDLVKYFLGNGADPNLRVRELGSVLQVAAAGGSVEVVRLLLDAGADIDMEGGTYNTALVAAASQEHHDVVSLLIKRGADIHAGSRTHGSSLYQAAAAGDTKSVVTLLGAGADVNDVIGMDGTPLHGAVHSGKISLVQLLIRRGADVNKGTGRGNGYPIVAAAEEGHAQIVRILLNAGADPNLVDGTDGKTVLEAAITSRDMPTFRAVLDGGGNPNTIFNSYINGFQSALWTGELAMARILLERHAEFEDKAFVESVHRYEQDPYFFHTLLERGANVDAHVGEKGSALHHAIVDGGEKATRLLLEKNPYLGAVSERGTPLCLAASKGMTDLAKELVRSGADVRRGVKWTAPLDNACRAGDKDLVAFLLEAGADVNFGGGAAINAALWNESEDLVRFLVEEHGADLNLVTKTGWNYTPMQQAVQEANMPMIKLLLSLGADINGPAGRCGTILHCAFGSMKRSRELIEFLLENGANVDDSVQGESLLCQAIYADMKDFIPRLIELGADVKQTRSDLTALGKSFMDGDQNTVDLLLAHGASFTDSGDSLLIEAVESKSIDEIGMLLDHGIDPNAKDCYKTALGEAAIRGDKDVIGLLLEYGGDLNAGVDIDRGALAKACDGPCNIDMVKFLLENGADPNKFRPTFRYPLLDAVRTGNLELVDLLLEHGADISYESGEIFHWAVYGGRKAITRLLDEDMSPAQREKYLDRAFQHAAHEANAGLCSWLLEQGANLNYSGGDYGSPIQAAVSNSYLYGKASINNRLLIIKTFIEKGATMPCPESVEKFGSPLSIAIRHRQRTSADLFLASSAFSDVNTLGGEYHTPLQAAARWLPGIVPRLLALGADVHETGGTFGTALHAAAYAKDMANMRLLLEGAGADAAVIAGKYGSAMQAAAKENAVVNGGFASGCASVRAMQLLKDHGAQVTAVGGKYHTALQMAVKSGNFEGFRWLLENGADPHIEGGKFGTIWKAATRKSKVRYDIISYLEQHIFKDTKADLNFDD